MYITLLRKNQSMQVKKLWKRKKEGKYLVYEETRQKQNQEININTLLCRGDGGIPTQSAKTSRMDGPLQMSSDLENAKINTNMQLYYSTISAQTNQLLTHAHAHTHTHKFNS